MDGADGRTSWRLSHRYDPPAVALADRHYSRQKVGTPQFLRPGSYVALVTDDGSAVWASWRGYQKHRWRGAWENLIFRNEGGELSSDLITEAVAATVAEWGDPPPLGMVTMVDVDAVRHKRDPGRCFRRAGFVPVGYTETRGRLVLQLAPDRFPSPVSAGWTQERLAIA